MLITKQDAVKLLHQHFGLTQPITVDDLKSAYRAKSKQLHPDLNPNGAEMFKEMQKAYEHLTHPNIISTICVDKDGKLVGVLKTTGGTPLSELGLGFGISKNGCDCNVCNHKGYVSHTSSAIERCTHCLFGSTSDRKCRPCKGTGEFTQKHSNRVVSCRDCKGKGFFQTPYYHKCEWCNGLFYTVYKTPTILYDICTLCKGVGEIEIFNPVIPKGLLATFRTKI